jgi:CheY-like chemotaxis protein
MDHMMPEMDGIETVRVIREEIGSEYAKNVHIIALTANALAGNDNMFKEHGFQDFLSKPIDIMKMDVALNTWVRDVGREKAYFAAAEAAVKTEAAVRPDMDRSEARETDDGKTSSAGEAPIHADEAPAAQKHKATSLSGVYIEGLDMEDGLRRLGGRESVYITILRSFAKGTPALLDRVRDCDEEGLPDYTIAVHGIKGSCRNVGAKALGDEAEALEMAAKAGELAKVCSETGALVLGVERLIADINAALG